MAAESDGLPSIYLLKLQRSNPYNPGTKWIATPLRVAFAVGKLVVQQVGARRIVAVQQRTLDRRSIRRADLGMLARVDPQLLCPVKHRRAQAQADLL